jgi:hypothetical protein
MSWMSAFTPPWIHPCGLLFRRENLDSNQVDALGDAEGHSTDGSAGQKVRRIDSAI